MRHRIFTENEFDAAVFIGGMGGIVDEYKLIQHLQPSTRVIPVATTGGAVLKLAEQMPWLDDDLVSDLDYVSLLHRHLSISVRERRYQRPDDQPVDIQDRYS